MYWGRTGEGGNTLLARKKKGCKARYVVYLGKTVEGLYVAYKPDQTVRNYYYIDEANRQVSCTSSLDTAVERFMAFKTGHSTGKQNRFSNTKSHSKGKTVQGHPAVSDKTEVSDDYVLARFVELLRANRAKVARRTGIPQLAHLDEINPIPPSLTMTGLLKVYLGGKKRNRVYMRDVRKYWNEFARHIDKVDVRDVTHSDIGSYRTMVRTCAEARSVGNKSRYINNRFLSVKAVIHYAAKMSEYTVDINKLAQSVRQLEMEAESVIKPRIISKEEFKQLYEKSADAPLGRCLILLGLNCAIRYADIADLRKSDIDLAAGKLSRPRTKTGIVQSSMLFTESVNALERYMASHPSSKEYVFVTRFKNRYPEKYLRIEFNRIRKAAGLSDITQRMLRCTVASIAHGAAINPNSIAIHMGWRISKVDNSYNTRPAEATTELVAVLHKHLFAEQDK